MTDEGMTRKQRLEDRSRDQVLRQHLDDLPIRDLVVQIISQLTRKGRESCLCFRMCITFQQGVDAVDMRLGDTGDIHGPIFPVVAVAAFFDHLGIDCPFNFPELEGHLKLPLLCAPAGIVIRRRHRFPNSMLTFDL